MKSVNCKRQRLPKENVHDRPSRPNNLSPFPLRWDRRRRRCFAPGRQTVRMPSPKPRRAYYRRGWQWWCWLAAKLTLLLNILGSPRGAPSSSRVHGSCCTMPEHFRVASHNTHTARETPRRTETLTLDEWTVGGRVEESCCDAGCQTPPAAPREMSLYLKDSATGENAPLAVLHSTDINRSSQDTQQLRASQTEPVRHRAGGWLVGGSTTRHNSFFFRLSPLLF